MMRRLHTKTKDQKYQVIKKYFKLNGELSKAGTTRYTNEIIKLIRNDKGINEYEALHKLKQKGITNVKTEGNEHFRALLQEVIKNGDNIKQNKKQAIRQGIKVSRKEFENRLNEYCLTKMLPKLVLHFKDGKITYDDVINYIKSLDLEFTKQSLIEMRDNNLYNGSVKTPMTLKNDIIVDFSNHNKAHNKDNKDKYQKGKFNYAIVYHAIVQDSRERKHDTIKNQTYSFKSDFKIPEMTEIF
jgi:hypothetical protein